MTAEFWFNEYLMPDGRQVRCWAGRTRREAVQLGAHVQGLVGALVILRWRVVAQLPAVFADQRDRQAMLDQTECVLPLPGEHWSDCAIHNEPAYPAGPCDCGVKVC